MGGALTGLVVLGATGSIGRSTLEVADGLADRVRVVALACHRDWRTLAGLAAGRRLDAVAIADPQAWREARTARAFDPATEILGGEEGLLALAAWHSADTVLNGIVGAAGLGPTLAALAAGKRVALANKESLVAGGDLVMARAHDGQLLPVDSEHNAIWQLLDGRDRAQVARIVLTASGGPFRSTPPARLAEVGPDEALAHPTWSMGPKITVDSATLANKGLEIIEAHHLFGMPYSRIDVVVHPQSIVHGLIETIDGTLFAELGRPDMRTPIRRALTWPERITARRRTDPTELSGLTFEPPDLERFPALSLARAAGEAGGTAPAVFNAANEVAVRAFLDRSLDFLGIAAVCERVLAEHRPTTAASVEDVLAADRWARARAAEVAARGTRPARAG
jgi:1-deoxy-D-xylulose-5-phosphate reductoisomerase